MPRIVTRRGERRHSRRELDVIGDGLEALDEWLDAASDVRAVRLRARERERSACTRYRASGRTTSPSSVGVPADVVDVQVREEDEVDVRRGATPELVERAGSSPSSSARPVPQPGGRPRCRPGSCPRRADEVARAREPPALAREELGIERAVRAPTPRAARPGSARRSSPSSPDRVEHARTRRSIATPTTTARAAARGSPCASCQETTGLRRTPIRSISASITSPGLR